MSAMEPYEITYRVLASDTDAYRRLRVSRLFTMLQEAAIAHTEFLGAGRDKTLDRGLLWVVTLQQAVIRRMPAYDDVIRLRSLPGEMLHAFYPRHYALTDGDGETLATASALWALMDAETRTMVFPAQSGVAIPGAKPAWETFFPAAPKLPQAAAEQRFTVPYSYVDLNGHMNNTRYFDLAEDLMPPALRARPLCEVRTEYTGEARLGETITLQTEAREDAFLLSGAADRRLFRIGMQYA